ncbi:MAG: methyltransferase domain-containing protein [Candidatus Lokiarchaeota archaeon]|nr:methyltransferase domain-containing protein [Candidatus Lokiarchaeota archaeon]
MWKKKTAKRLPPEDMYKSPKDYYTYEVMQNYMHSKSMMWIQEKITKRALELLDAEVPSLILDLGMGCGFSTSYLYMMGYDVIGIELIYQMLVEYNIWELNPINADMKCLPLRGNTFDFIISISAFQWLINKLDDDELSSILKNIASVFYNLLKSKGKAVIQFYPSSDAKLQMIGRIFADYGHFKGNFIIDNPQGGPKKKIYLYLEK